MENITDTDNKYAKRVREDFLIQNLGKYRDLYAQNDTLLLADLFESSPASAQKYKSLVIFHQST